MSSIPFNTSSYLAFFDEAKQFLHRTNFIKKLSCDLEFYVKEKTGWRRKTLSYELKTPSTLFSEENEGNYLRNLHQALKALGAHPLSSEEYDEYLKSKQIFDLPFESPEVQQFLNMMMKFELNHLQKVSLPNLKEFQDGIELEFEKCQGAKQCVKRLVKISYGSFEDLDQITEKVFAERVPRVFDVANPSYYKTFAYKKFIDETSEILKQSGGIRSCEFILSFRLPQQNPKQIGSCFAMPSFRQWPISDHNLFEWLRQTDMDDKDTIKDLPFESPEMKEGLAHFRQRLEDDRILGSVAKLQQWCDNFEEKFYKSSYKQFSERSIKIVYENKSSGELKELNFSDNMEHRCCAGCSKPATMEHTLHVCSSCLITRYCNTTCQKADWKKHKVKCKNPQSSRIKR